MKILLYSGQFYPKIVGSGTIAYLIAKELSSKGHEVTVVVDEEILSIPINAEYPFKIKSIKSLKDFVIGFSSFKTASEMTADLFKNEKFDIVHIFSFMPMLLISLMRNLIKAPIVFTFWNTPNKNERAVGFYNDADLDLELAKSIIEFKKYDGIVVGSKCWLDCALSLGSDPDKTYFSYIGIDLDEFRKDQLETDLNMYFENKLNGNDIILTLPSRITPQKGILEAIKALEIVNKTREVKLLLTGMANPYKKEFANKILDEADKIGIRQNIIIPNKTILREHMYSLYKRSDIVILPSYYEGLGLSAIEALASERPLIATNVSGLNEVAINNKNSLLVPAKDPESLANAIIKLLNNNNLRNRLASAGPKSVLKFDIKRFVDFLEEKYYELKTN